MKDTSHAFSIVSSEHGGDSLRRFFFDIVPACSLFTYSLVTMKSRFFRTLELPIIRSNFSLPWQKLEEFRASLSFEPIFVSVGGSKNRETIA